MIPVPTSVGKPSAKAALESSAERPRALPVNPDGIPDELKERDQWVGWRYEWRVDKAGKGKWTKVPINPDTGRKARANDPSTWGSFGAALERCRSDGLDGIGFEFSADDPYCGVDLDDCRGRDTGAVTAWGQDLVGRLDSYGEASPSGTGAKVLVKGKKPGDRCSTKYKTGKVEVYESGRFFALTGQRLEGTPPTVNDRQGPLEEVYRLVFEAGPEAPGPATSEAAAVFLAEAEGPRPVPPSSAPLTDDEVLAKASGAKDGAKFTALWAGDTGGYGGDDSRADQALCNLLAFWTRKDAAQMDRLFRRSGLMRDKWDEKRGKSTYGRGTIRKAIRDVAAVYGGTPPDRQGDQGDQGHRRNGRAAPPAGGGRRPAIFLSAEEHKVNAEAARALAADPTVFRRGNVLARVLRDAPPEKGIGRDAALPVIGLVPDAILSERLTAVAQFMGPAPGRRKKGGRPQFVPKHPPALLVKAVRDRGEWPGLRPLEGVAGFPLLRPDGSVLDVPGYDPQTGLIFEPVVTCAPLPRRVGGGEIKAALDALFEAVCDFPFAAPVHRSAWLAALLTPLARRALRGPAPLFAIDGNAAGLGKGLLANVVSHVLTGRGMTVMTAPGYPEEWRKRITALALAGDQLVLIDNVPDKFGSDELNAALTAVLWKDRLLGRSEMTAELPLLATWFCTGNNLHFEKDTDRRACRVRLVWKGWPEPKPEERTGFRHPRLLAWVRREQPRLLAAALTVLKGYCDAGRPDMGLVPWGSYEEWDALVRSAVVWCGQPDPGATRHEPTSRPEKLLPDLFAGLEFLDPGRKGLRVSEVLQAVGGAAHEGEPRLAAMRRALELLCGVEASRQALSVGKHFGYLQGVEAGGKKLACAGTDRNGVKLWAVIATAEVECG
jgi:hypothetical protein